jgi:putative transposase
MRAMARQARLCLPGQAHLVLQRASADVFREAGDYEDYLRRLAHTAQRSGVQVHGYALLPRAVWLVLTPADCAGLSGLMQTLARCASRRRGEGAGIWQGRYRSALLQQQTWLLPALCAVDLTPQAEGACAEAAAWPWSSLAHHTGRRPSAWLREVPPYWDLGNTPYAREAAYAALLSTDVARQHRETIERALRAAGALGDEAYLAWAGEQLGRSLGPRARGRPRVAAPGA